MLIAFRSTRKRCAAVDRNCQGSMVALLKTCKELLINTKFNTCIRPPQKHFAPHGNSLFDFELILFPINVKRNHWVLGAIDMQQKIIGWYDSKRGSADVADSNHFGKLIVRWLESQYLHAPAQGDFIKKGAIDTAAVRKRSLFY